MTEMISLNQRVLPIVHHLIDDAEALGCRYYRLSNGAHVIDKGINVPGGWEASRLFCHIDLADLGRVEYRDFPLTENLSVAGVEVYVNNIDLACVASQIAGLRLGHGDFAAIGSGQEVKILVVAD